MTPGCRAPRFCTATALIALATAPFAALAQPVVVADIPPVAALSDSLLGAEGATVLLIGPGTSPHSAALRPSQARGLQDADLVIGLGPALTPGLWEQIEALAGDVPHLTLMEVDGLTRLPFPEDGAGHDHGHDAERASEDHGHDGDDHDHDHADHAEKDHGHDDHGHDHGDEDHAGDDHGHEDHGHEDHADDDHGHGDHAHDHAHAGNTDPHMWLNPENAALWLDTLAERFAALDAENAATYAERAEAEKAEIAQATQTVADLLTPHAGTYVINSHDDMRYFTDRFGLQTAGAVIPADGTSPGAGSVVALSERMAVGDIGCLLTDPSHPSRLAEQLAADAGIASAELAPLGQPGQSYPEMLVALGEGLAACLNAEG